MPAQKITDRQRGFLLRLAEERELDGAARDRLVKALRISEDPEELGMTSETASRSIEWLLARPLAAREPATVQVEKPGVFEVGDDIFVVKPNRAGTRLYAKRLVDAGDRLNARGERVGFDFEYDRGAIFRIREEHRMSVERAKELTIRYGRCINCGRRLKAAVSVERGIGPVCIKRFAA